MDKNEGMERGLWMRSADYRTWWMKYAYANTERGYSHHNYKKLFAIIASEVISQQDNQNE